MCVGANKPIRGQILFVDDDAFYRDLAGTALGEAGFQVHIANDGQQAVAAVTRQPFDLIVLDLAMPGMSGFDVLETIRTTLMKTDVPVLVITGHDDTQSVERAFDFGATSFLVKPLNWLLFVHHVNFVLKSARAQSDLRDANRTADLMSKVKSRLVGTLVTEFQSPLRSAFSVATLLRQEADGPIESPLYRSLIADLYRAVAQLNGTHIKMLNFGRNLAEGISLDEAVLDPVEVVEAAVEAAREKARRRQIDIRLSFSQPRDIQLHADRVLIGQVLGAVLGNSVQFSRRASTIDVEMRLTNARDLAILVRDTSSGLTQANIDDLLGVSAAGAVATPESADHGSGLKLARVLTEAHQGQLSVELTEDEGAVIQIRLPKTRLKGLAPAEDIGARRAVSTAPAARALSEPAPRRLAG